MNKDELGISELHGYIGPMHATPLCGNSKFSDVAFSKGHTLDYFPTGMTKNICVSPSFQLVFLFDVFKLRKFSALGFNRVCENYYC